MEDAERIFEPKPMPEGRTGPERLAYHLRQQQVLAEFGRCALTAPDMDALLNEAVRLCAEGMGARYCKALEYLPEEDRLLIRAGLGITANQLILAQIGAGSLLFLLGRYVLFPGQGAMTLPLSIGLALPAVVAPRFALKLLEGRRVTRFEAQLAEERDRSLEGLHHDADVVHPSNRHGPASCRLVPSTQVMSSRSLDVHDIPRPTAGDGSVCRDRDVTPELAHRPSSSVGTFNPDRCHVA